MPPERRNSEALNILTIMTDQQRFDSLSCAGNPVVHTPHLDRLASEGALFTDAVCSTPLCGPSRASLLTGLFYHGHGLMHNAGVFQGGMREEAQTVDKLLHEAGYRVEYHGKWHTGRANRGCYAGGVPDYIELYHRHLKERYGERPLRPDQKIDRHIHWPYRYLPVDEMMAAAEKAGLEMPHHNEAGQLEVEPEDTLTAWTAQRVIDLLEGKLEEPFAVTCSFLHPHAPLLVAEPYFSLYDPARMPLPANVEDGCAVEKRKSVPDGVHLTPEGLGTFIALYYGLVKEVDDWVGRLLDALDRGGYRDNTLVIFVSDHGELMGNHGTFSKTKMFEESIRIPLIMRCPGIIPCGLRCSAPVSGVDLAPTILDLAGVPVSGAFHGRSLRPLFIPGGAWDREYAFCEYRDTAAIRSGSWKLVLNPCGSANLKERAFLYDLRNDPQEMANLLSVNRRDSASLELGLGLKRRMIGIMEDLRIVDHRIDIYHRLDLGT